MGNHTAIYLEVSKHSSPSKLSPEQRAEEAGKYGSETEQECIRARQRARRQRKSRSRRKRRMERAPAIRSRRKRVYRHPRLRPVWEVAFGNRQRRTQKYQETLQISLWRFRESAPLCVAFREETRRTIQAL